VRTRGWRSMVSPLERERIDARAVRGIRRYLDALTSNYVLLGVSLLTQVVTVPLFLAALGQRSFGTWLMILQATQIISFSTTWIALPVVRTAAECCVARNPDRARTLYNTATLYYAAVGAVVTIGGIGLLTLGLTEIQGDWAPMAVALLQVPLYMQFNLSFSLLAGWQRMPVANLLFATMTPLSAGLGGIGLWAGLGVMGLALGLVASTAIIAGAAWVLARPCWQHGKAPLRVDRPMLRTLMASGVGHLGYSAAYVLRQSDIILVGILLSPALAAVYGIAFKLADLAVQIAWKAADSLYPMMAELDAASERERSQQLERLGTIAALAVASLGALLTAFFGEAVVSLWVGSMHAAPPAVFAWLGLMVALQALVHASTISVYGTTKMRSIAAVTIAEGLVKVGLTWALLPRVGLAGAPLASVLASIGLSGWYVPWQTARRRGRGGIEHLAAVLKPVAPAAALGGMVALGIRAFDFPPVSMLMAGVPVVVMCYGGALYMLGLGDEERAGFRLALRHLANTLRWGLT
jgi:O-antigen/teichoic acid export membrane protein